MSKRKRKGARLTGRDTLRLFEDSDGLFEALDKVLEGFRPVLMEALAAELDDVLKSDQTFLAIPISGRRKPFDIQMYVDFGGNPVSDPVWTFNLRDLVDAEIENLEDADEPDADRQALSDFADQLDALAAHIRASLKGKR
jgi:HPt (histidine-containing phosphotransfer) domain-containing protein